MPVPSAPIPPATSPSAPLTHGLVTPGAPLFVVAAHSEAAAFDASLPVLITGIGKIAAATILTECLWHYRAAGGMPSAIVNIGTAGALREGCSGTHVINTVMLHDFSHAAVAGITGRLEYGPIELGGDSPAAAAGTMVLATGDEFVTKKTVREQLAREADLVDMEGYAVAYVARRFGVPVELVKHVSDSADEQSARRWVDDMPVIAQELAAQARQR